MSKCKELFVGFGLVVITFFMWLVSSCSQPLRNSSSIEPTTVGNPIAAESPKSISSVLDININSYRLTINGTVNYPLSLSYEQIQAYAAVTKNVEIICPDIEDQTDEWTGVPVSTLLTQAGVTPGASEVVFTGADGYLVQLPLESVLQDGVFLAYTVNSQKLPQDRGYPLRLVVSGSLGSEWVGVVTNIEVKPASVSFINPSTIIRSSSGNISISGRKLCSCLFLALRGPSKS